MWGHDRLTQPELFGERSNNSLKLQGGAPIGRGSNLPHRRFVLKSDKQMEYDRIHTGAALANVFEMLAIEHAKLVDDAEHYQVLCSAGC